VRLRVLWVGRPKASPYETEVETYRRRVSRRWPAEDVPVRPVSGGREADPRRVLAAEAEAIQRLCPDGWPVILLDERGSTPDSPAFAAMLGQHELEASPGLVFALGSDLGLDPDLLRSAAVRLSLGRMTLPHLLARLVLWEQLFRATHILSGGRYHRPGVQ
jgi:23S rRNA (pseudouridine1915-N3)-methyltransferase